MATKKHNEKQAQIDEFTQDIDEKQAQIDELTQDIERMRVRRDEKIAQNKEHMGQRLGMLATKYMTVNGYLSCQEAVTRADYKKYLHPADVQNLTLRLAEEMSELAQKVKADFDAYEGDKWSEIVDGLIDEEFCKRASIEDYDVAKEILVVEFCQNVGGSLEDMEGFVEETKRQIEDCEKKLAELQGSSVS